MGPISSFFFLSIWFFAAISVISSTEMIKFLLVIKCSVTEKKSLLEQKPGQMFFNQLHALIKVIQCVYYIVLFFDGYIVVDR